MTTVHQLLYVREYPDRRETELSIGIFATDAEAKAAVEQLKTQRGFRDYPDGFQIHEVTLGEFYWKEGFITDWGPPPADAESEPFDLPDWMADPRSPDRAQG